MCREYAHRRFLDYADQIEHLASMPGTTSTADEMSLAARAAREIAMKFVEPGTQEPRAD